MSKELEQTIKELMAIILDIDATKIEDGTAMETTPGWDSANHINLVLALEEEFSVSFEVSEFESMVSFSEIVKALRPKV